MPTGRLEQGKRKAARLALYGSLALMIVLLAASVHLAERAVRSGARWGEQRLAGDPAVEQLREYIRIPTTRGREIDGAEFLAAQLAAAGIEATIEPIGAGRANLWAVLEGRDPGALVLHHHIDVWDPGNLEEWLFPPFEAAIEGPWLYGRGAFDMKSYGIAQLRAFLDAASLDRPLERSLILLATSDEENGSVLGTRWFLERHPELVDRFWAVLTEGGIVEALNTDDIKYWGIETTQMQVVPVTICSPDSDRLELFLEDLESSTAHEAPPRLTAELSQFLDAYAPTRSQRRLRSHLGDPELLLRHRWGYDRLPPFARLLFHNRTTPETIEVVAGGGYSLRVWLQLLPGSDPQAAVAELLPPWITIGLDVSVGNPIGASEGSPVDHPLFRQAEEVLRRVYPESTVGPMFLPWTLTDSRFFRAAGVPSYGFSPFLFFSTDTVRVDRINERIPLPGFLSGVDIYSELVESIVAGSEVDNPSTSD